MSEKLTDESGCLTVGIKKTPATGVTDEMSEKLTDESSCLTVGIEKTPATGGTDGLSEKLTDENKHTVEMEMEGNCSNAKLNAVEKVYDKQESNEHKNSGTGNEASPAESVSSDDIIDIDPIHRQLDKDISTDNDSVSSGRTHHNNLDVNAQKYTIVVVGDKDNDSVHDGINATIDCTSTDKDAVNSEKRQADVNSEKDAVILISDKVRENDGINSTGYYGKTDWFSQSYGCNMAKNTNINRICMRNTSFVNDSIDINRKEHKRGSGMSNEFKQLSENLQPNKIHDRKLRKHCVCVIGSDIEFDINIKGLRMKAVDKFPTEVKDVLINQTFALTLLKELGYNCNNVGRFCEYHDVGEINVFKNVTGMTSTRLDNPEDSSQQFGNDVTDGQKSLVNEQTFLNQLHESLPAIWTNSEQPHSKTKRGRKRALTQKSPYERPKQIANHNPRVQGNPAGNMSFKNKFQPFINPGKLFVSKPATQTGYNNDPSNQVGQWITGNNCGHAGSQAFNYFNLVGGLIRSPSLNLNKQLSGNSGLSATGNLLGPASQAYSHAGQYFGTQPITQPNQFFIQYDQCSQTDATQTDNISNQQFKRENNLERMNPLGNLFEPTKNPFNESKQSDKPSAETDPKFGEVAKFPQTEQSVIPISATQTYSNPNQLFGNPKRSERELYYRQTKQPFKQTMRLFGKTVTNKLFSHTGHIHGLTSQTINLDSQTTQIKQATDEASVPKFQPFATGHKSSDETILCEQGELLFGKIRPNFKRTISYPQKNLSSSSTAPHEDTLDRQNDRTNDGDDINDSPIPSKRRRVCSESDIGCKRKTNKNSNEVSERNAVVEAMRNLIADFTKRADELKQKIVELERVEGSDVEAMSEHCEISFEQEPTQIEQAMNNNGAECGDANEIIILASNEDSTMEMPMSFTQLRSDDGLDEPCTAYTVADALTENDNLDELNHNYNCEPCQFVCGPAKTSNKNPMDYMSYTKNRHVSMPFERRMKEGWAVCQTCNRWFKERNRSKHDKKCFLRMGRKPLMKVARADLFGEEIKSMWLDNFIVGCVGEVLEDIIVAVEESINYRDPNKQ